MPLHITYTTRIARVTGHAKNEGISVICHQLPPMRASTKSNSGAKPNEERTRAPARRSRHSTLPLSTLHSLARSVVAAENGSEATVAARAAAAATATPPPPLPLSSQSPPRSTPSSRPAAASTHARRRLRRGSFDAVTSPPPPLLSLARTTRARATPSRRLNQQQPSQQIRRLHTQTQTQTQSLKTTSQKRTACRRKFHHGRLRVRRHQADRRLERRPCHRQRRSCASLDSARKSAVCSRTSA